MAIHCVLHFVCYCAADFVCEFVGSAARAFRDIDNLVVSRYLLYLRRIVRVHHEKPLFAFLSHEFDDSFGCLIRWTTAVAKEIFKHFVDVFICDGVRSHEKQQVWDLG
jgi:hypothetical protein